MDCESITDFKPVTPRSARCHLFVRQHVKTAFEQYSFIARAFTTAMSNAAVKSASPSLNDLFLFSFDIPKPS